MNGRNSYLVVGVFVSLGLAALVFMILGLAGRSSSEPNNRYSVFFQRDISGLTLGAPVRYLGVGVGQVVDMQLTTTGDTRVRVDLEVLQSTPITTATYASLAFQGVTGVAFISLAADELDQTMSLVAGLDEYPVIRNRDVGLAALLSEAPEISRQVTRLLDRASRLLDENNSAALSRSLANIEKFTASLVGDNDGAVPIPEQVRTVLAEVERTIKRVQSTLDHAEPDLFSTMTKLNQASTNLANVSARLNGLLSDGERDIDQFISGGLGQAAALVTDTRNTMRELEKLLAELREVPSQLVYKPQTDPVVIEP